MLFYFLIGTMTGFSLCSIFATRQYDKGFKDGVRSVGNNR
jgi:hypothetical protein